MRERYVAAINVARPAAYDEPDPAGYKLRVNKCDDV